VDVYNRKSAENSDEIKAGSDDLVLIISEDETEKLINVLSFYVKNNNKTGKAKKILDALKKGSKKPKY